MGGPDGPDTSKAAGAFHKRVYGDTTYEDLAQNFRAELYNNAEDWAQLFNESGVQMAILTSKHHDVCCQCEGRLLSCICCTHANTYFTCG
eukprot:m.763622 g.763622  ORF g.763622 m.763622 type:complete len:90 (+) comp23211_c0_seq59:594-863(+)